MQIVVGGGIQSGGGGGQGHGKNVAFLKPWKSVSRVSEEKVVKFLLKIQDFVMQFITVYILHERYYLFLIMYIHNINATTNYYR
jgi:hypothetical protein